MKKAVLIVSAAAVMAACSAGTGRAQANALKDLLGDSGELAEAAPAVPDPLPAIDKRAGGEYSYVDPQRVVPARPLGAALRYYKANKARLGNADYLSVIDYTQRSENKRLYVIDMRTGAVERFLVAHGKGSDPDHTGYATVFSNEDSTHASSLGFYLTGSTYDGDNGYSLQLYGQDPTNSNALARSIVMHGAKYVDPALPVIGRSWGCPAVELSVRTRLIDMLKGGSVIYAYHEKFSL
jgi:hypothetical protein